MFQKSHPTATHVISKEQNHGTVDWACEACEWADAITTYNLAITCSDFLVHLCTWSITFQLHSFTIIFFLSFLCIPPFLILFLSSGLFPKYLTFHLLFLFHPIFCCSSVPLVFIFPFEPITLWIFECFSLPSCHELGPILSLLKLSCFYFPSQASAQVTFSLFQKLKPSLLLLYNKE